MIDRNDLTSSPIYKKKNQAQASVSESGVERSCYGTDNFSLQKPSPDKRKLVQKKFNLNTKNIKYNTYIESKIFF